MYDDGDYDDDAYGPPEREWTGVALVFVLLGAGLVLMVLVRGSP